MKKLKTRDEWLNEGHSYDNEIEKARMMQGSASDLVEWATRKIAESRPENFKEGVISPIQEAKESYKIMRLVNGRTKEMIEGTIGEIMDQFSKAIDKLRDSGSGKQFKDDPKTIEELVHYLNAAQQYIEKKDKPKNTYAIHEARKSITKKHWDKADDDQKEEWLLQAFSDPDDAMEYIEMDWNDLPPQATSNMYESVNENKSQEKKIHKWLSDHGVQTPDSVEFDYTFTDDGGMEFDVKIEKGVVTLYDGEEDTTMGYKEFMKDFMNESVNEGDMTNKHGGFLITYVPNGMRLKATYKKGVDSKKREEAAFAKILKDNPKVKEKDLKITGYFGKKEYADLVQDIPVRLDEAGEVRLNEADDNWSDDVKTKWTPPKGLFTEPANKIADVLHKESDDLDQAMSRLQFYINRGGKLLDGKAKANLESAKKLLQQKYK